MNEEIKKWLSENLTIEADTDSSWDGEHLVVKLKLEDEEISRTTLPLSWLKTE